MTSSVLRRVLSPTAVLCALALGSTLPVTGHAAPDQSNVSSTFGDSTSDTGLSQDNDTATTTRRNGNEHMTVRGHHSLPAGYQDAPSVDFTHGPDPDHDIASHRDSVTGSNLTHFGSAYQDTGPQRGQLGDATGNGWVTPR
ncbi:MAG: hypothetical protein SOH81_07180 [Acetobacter sp.]|jgi:hypothetical protein